MRLFSLVCVAAFALCAITVQAQAPIPYRPDGFQIGGPVDAPIVMDAFVDLLCPDCAAAWPGIKSVVDYYKQNISVALHFFPLPYHNNGFMMAQAAHTVLDAQPTNAGLARQLGDLMFNTAQSQFWNGATADQSFNAIKADMGKVLVSANLVTQAVYDAGMADDNINNEARVSWKFACSKGVLGTPTFFINGVNVNGDPTWGLADWRAVLDPLLQPQPTSHAKIAAAAAPQKSTRKHHRKHHSRSEKKAMKKDRHHARPVASKVPAAKSNLVDSSNIAAEWRKQRASGSGCLKQRGSVGRTFTSDVSTCPVGEPACAYLPGKIECCFAGEMCIPNVGCRC